MCFLYIINYVIDNIKTIKDNKLKHRKRYIIIVQYIYSPNFLFILNIKLLVLTIIDFAMYYDSILYTIANNGIINKFGNFIQIIINMIILH